MDKLKMTTTLLAFLVQLPVIIVWLVGLVLALGYRQKHPWVALLTIIALTGFLLTSLVSSYLNTWLPLDLVKRGWSTTQVGQALAIRGIIGSLVAAGFWGLLLAAIFGWRNSRKEQ